MLLRAVAAAGRAGLRGAGARRAWLPPSRLRSASGGLSLALAFVGSRRSARRTCWYPALGLAAAAAAAAGMEGGAALVRTASAEERETASALRMQAAALANQTAADERELAAVEAEMAQLADEAGPGGGRGAEDALAELAALRQARDDERQLSDATRAGALWPKDKLRRAAPGDKAKRAVLVMTGALNPVHTGHVASLVSARRALEAEGWEVVGGWLSPSHKTYVKPKMKQTGGRYFPTAVRLHCVALAVEDSDWIMPGAWESLGPHEDWPDFPKVVANLQQEMAGCEAEHGPVTVFYCCGFDHYMKCGLHRGMRNGAGLVVLPRDDSCAESKTGTRGPIVGVGMGDAPPDVSSTLIRKGLKKGDAMGLAGQGLLHPAVAQYLDAIDGRAPPEPEPEPQ